MIDLMKKTFLTGVGLSLMTKDKVEQVARDIANSAQMTSDKGQEFINEAIARAEQGRADLESTVYDMVQDALKKADVPTRAEFDQLAARVSQLEAARSEQPE